jgi:hypothetical protein
MDRRLRLLAVVAGLVSLACLAAVGSSRLSAEETVRPPLYTPGDITAADLSVDPDNGEVVVGYFLDGNLASVRYAPDGRELARWHTPAFGATSAVAVHGRTHELYDASTHDGAITLIRYRGDGMKLSSWNSGFKNYATDVEADEWTGEVVMGRYTGDSFSFVTLSKDGSLLSSWASGYDDPAGVVAQTPSRVYYGGVSASEGDGGVIARYDDLGRKTAEWPIDERPVAMAHGPDGVLYVATRTEKAHRGSVLQITDLGTIVSRWPLGARPVDIKVEQDSDVYLLLLRSYGRALEVVRLGPDGTPRASWMARMQLALPVLRKGA